MNDYYHHSLVCISLSFIIFAWYNLNIWFTRLSSHSLSTHKQLNVAREKHTSMLRVLTLITWPWPSEVHLVMPRKSVLFLLLFPPTLLGDYFILSPQTFYTTIPASHLAEKLASSFTKKNWKQAEKNFRKYPLLYHSPMCTCAHMFCVTHFFIILCKANPPTPTSTQFSHFPRRKKYPEVSWNVVT